MTKIDPMALVQGAREGGYAIGGFNMHSVETTQALIRAAEKADAPVFLQVGRAIIPHMGLEEAYYMTRRELDKSGAEAVIHLDHGTRDEVLLAIQLGFDSVMFDGSHMRLEDNIRATRQMVEIAHTFGIPVEAELGRIPDAGTDVDWDAYYTNVDEAERFVAETKVDLLAVSAGVVHGVPSAKSRPLDTARVERIGRATGIPLVLHGASGVPADELRAAIDVGVAKLNADTDLRHAFRRGIEDTWAQGDRQLEAALSEGRRLMIEATVQKMVEFGCAGKAAGKRERVLM